MKKEGFYMYTGYRIPEEELSNFMKDGAMNDQYGIQLFFNTDPKRARELLPPPLEPADPANPMCYVYVVNIRQPTFSPWYMEGGLGIIARLGDYEGVYFLGLMLSGPGALMGVFSGRESSGLAKKLCERILVERTGDVGRCLIRRDGVDLVDVKLKMGSYNQKGFGTPQEGSTREKPTTIGGGCLNHKYEFGWGGISNLRVNYYDSPTRVYSWEPAEAEVTLTSSFNDRWGELPVTNVIGAGWMVSDNWVVDQKKIYEYTDEQEMTQAMSLLLPGRYDRCTFLKDHQTYE